MTSSTTHKTTSKAWEQLARERAALEAAVLEPSRTWDALDALAGDSAGLDLTGELVGDPLPGSSTPTRYVVERVGAVRFSQAGLATVRRG